MEKELEASDGYASMSSVIRNIKKSSFPARCGKVKRAPTLSELEGDDNSYYSTDDTHYEDRR